ncbi:hypothetical protein ABMA28_001708 [Loxostege sticticalis]|uniref:Uncharacterized protein n=1 Tax=Loxostege sticticalis TaxID=481309 RepID=A0ABD0T2N6_LOXSC
MRGSSPASTGTSPPADVPTTASVNEERKGKPKKEGVVKEKPSKEGAKKEKPSKEGPVKEKPSKEGAGKEKPSKEGAGKAKQSKDGAGKEKPSKEGAGKEKPSKEGAGKEKPSKEGKEKKSKEGAGKDKEQAGKEHEGRDKHRPPVPKTVPVPTTSTFKETGTARSEDPEDKLPCWRRFSLYLYNREKGTYCGRTCRSWLYIFVYSIMYLMFLTTYMLIFLFATLSILKSKLDYKDLDKTRMLTYSEYGIGLTATPTTESSYPLIWYKNGNEEDYKKYVKSIDKLLLSRKRRDAETSLGQCGQSPYGYGGAPCVIVRINKQLKWTGKALGPNSTLTNAPKEVQDWVKSGRRMLWLHCGGYYSYDKEHIRSIRYYPNPPGFDPALFPLDVRNDPPLVAVQFSSFSHGVSLAVECKLWHEHGPSSVEFVIYVEPRDKSHVNVSNTFK